MEIMPIRKSPYCGDEAYDLDCDECGASGDDGNGDVCNECDGEGYIGGWFECSTCGDTFDNLDCVEEEAK